MYKNCGMWQACKESLLAICGKIENIVTINLELMELLAQYMNTIGFAIIGGPHSRLFASKRCLISYRAKSYR